MLFPRSWVLMLILSHCGTGASGCNGCACARMAPASTAAAAAIIVVRMWLLPGLSVLFLSAADRTAEPLGGLGRGGGDQRDDLVDGFARDRRDLELGLARIGQEILVLRERDEARTQRRQAIGGYLRRRDDRPRHGFLGQIELHDRPVGVVLHEIEC